MSTYSIIRVVFWSFTYCWASSHQRYHRGSDTRAAFSLGLVWPITEESSSEFSASYLTYDKGLLFVFFILFFPFGVGSRGCLSFLFPVVLSQLWEIWVFSPTCILTTVQLKNSGESSDALSVLTPQAHPVLSSSVPQLVHTSCFVHPEFSALSLSRGTFRVLLGFLPSVLPPINSP